MRSALQSQELDFITSDHAMPQFSAPAALAKEIRPAVPFIIVSGEMDLNLVVSLMRSGARDCIQKQELQLLIQTIERELREVKLRRERNRWMRRYGKAEPFFKPRWIIARRGLPLPMPPTGNYVT
jgi:two-component system, NarL family, sensor histidine kinase UhpB